MLAELSIIPIGESTHTSEAIADALRLIDRSGLPYQLTPSGTCIEGEWAQVIELVRQCHYRVRQHSPHVVTMIKIEDEEGESDKLHANIHSVETKVGQPVNKTENV